MCRANARSLAVHIASWAGREAGLLRCEGVGSRCWGSGGHGGLCSGEGEEGEQDAGGGELHFEVWGGVYTVRRSRYRRSMRHC